MGPLHEELDTPAISYEEFGRRFFEYAVSEERIAKAFGELAGTSFDFGPIGAGPGKLARVTARVDLGEPQVSRQDGKVITFDLVIPLRVALVVALAIDKQHFDVDGSVHLRLTARAAAPLRVSIEVDQPSIADVHIAVASQTRRGSLLQIVASIDTEIKRFVAKYISKEIRKPQIEKARNIDVAARIDAALTKQGI